MSRARRIRPSLFSEEGKMGVMHIPGHQDQKPGEVSLAEIRAVLGDCHLCPLGETRNQLVFGVGNSHARVMFVGEAPGKNEDLKGEPLSLIHI